jgi:predicted amidohydrolase YtcJ
MRNKLKWIGVLIVLVVVVGCQKNSNDNNHVGDPQTLFSNGDIITMEDSSVTYVEAVLVENGKIVFTGNKADAEKMMSSNVVRIDLQGKTLLPGFVDSHSHSMQAGSTQGAAQLFPPPDGSVKDMATLARALKDWYTNNPKGYEGTGIIFGIGYDVSQLTEKREPTATDLDEASQEAPIFVVSMSGHVGGFNHKAMEMLGINASIKDPAGGKFIREKDGKTLTGVMEEVALFSQVARLFSLIDSSAIERQALAALTYYKENGYTTIQEGKANIENAETWKKLAAKGMVDIDVNIYPDLRSTSDYIHKSGITKTYNRHVRMPGVKFTLDGAIQNKTAFMTIPYKVPPPGASKKYNGYPAFARQAELDSLIELCYANDWQILAHCNGDSAASQYLSAIQKAVGKHGIANTRNVMIHAQMVREDQLDKMKVLGIIPSFFPLHTYYWGDYHIDETMGKERAMRISPAVSALKRDMIFTMHSDAPVVSCNPLLVLHCAVNRNSRNGVIMGSDQRITPYVGLEALTKWGAYQYGEEVIKGTLKKGKLADFVILEKNPLKVDPKTIRDIIVIETIKEGKVVYKRK